MESLPGVACPSCNAPAMASANFCPNCGKPLGTLLPSTSFSKQVVVYLISFFIAPFGLWYAWKYLKQDDQKSKIIGIVAVALTLLAIAITIWTIRGLMESVNQSLHSLGL
jgi:uncharacterized OB-fold protein